MARRWTPQRFIRNRRLRIIVCAAVTVLAAIIAFCTVSVKTVKLSYNGKVSTVHTAAVTAQGMLREQGIRTKTHDFITSDSGDILSNGSTVTVRTAYQSTITIDGQVVNFWTYATDASQILSFFKQNEENAVKVSVDINNIYNTLTGGFTISSRGSAYLQVDGQKIKIDDGNTTAAAVLDAHSIQLGKDDRVNVIQSSGETILRVQRVSYTTSTKQVPLPYATQYVEDPSLDEGVRTVSQAGKEGSEIQTFRNVVVDGAVESSVMVKQAVTSYAVNEVITIGTKKKQEPQAAAPKTDDTSKNTGAQPTPSAGPSQDPQPSSSPSGPSGPSQPSQSGKPDKLADGKNQDTAKKAEADRKAEAAKKAEEQRKAAEEKQKKEAVEKARRDAAEAQKKQAQQQAGSTWHATPAQARIYGQAAAAQYGWTGNEWQAVAWLFNKESGWRWDASNRSSGAYGIPQALPGSKMATSGADWHDNAATQINWGLNYIKNRYGTPSKAKAFHLTHNWY